MHCLLVTGLQRSGTSALAGIAHHLGIHMFPPGGNYEPPQDIKDRYPHGNFEDRKFNEIIWEATEGAPHRGRDAQRDFRRRMLDAFTPEIESRLDAWLFDRVRETHNGWFGVKLPVLYYAMRPLVNFLRERHIGPMLATTARPFQDVVRSLAKKRGHLNDERHPEAWSQAVMSYNNWNYLKGLQVARAMNVTMFRFPFSHIVHHPGAVAQTLCTMTGVEFRPEAASVVDASLHAA